MPKRPIERPVKHSEPHARSEHHEPSPEEIKALEALLQGNHQENHQIDANDELPDHPDAFNDPRFRAKKISEFEAKEELRREEEETEMRRRKLAEEHPQLPDKKSGGLIYILLILILLYFVYLMIF